MRKLQFKFICFFVIVAIFIISGCFKRQIVLTPEQEPDRQYYEVLNIFNQAEKEFTSKLVKYNNWCEKPEYDEACSALDEYWYKANTALEAWKDIVDSRKNDTIEQDNYLDALKTLKSNILMEAPNFIW